MGRNSFNELTLADVQDIAKVRNLISAVSVILTLWMVRNVDWT
jgi:hypothetical protein